MNTPVALAWGLSDKAADFKIGKIIRDKEGPYIIIKGSICQEDKEGPNMYTPNNRASKYKNIQKCKK